MHMLTALHFVKMLVAQVAVLAALHFQGKLTITEWYLWPHLFWACHDVMGGRACQHTIKGGRVHACM